ncbi:hypothetical protein CRUP_020642 [Coryphaenoides rupestris]|nr:hypothetical protein CRUP_020642 [Coryphaenoides rupestris]
MAASETEDHDHLWCINHDSFPFKKPLMEAQMMSDVDGHSWALSAIDEERPSRVSTPLNRELIPLTDSPVVVQQHNIPQRKFVLLSTKGSHIFHKLRPVDQLRHLLVTCAGGESEEVERFFKLHREEQACATSLILACSRAASDREVSQWATSSFFRNIWDGSLAVEMTVNAGNHNVNILESTVGAANLACVLQELLGLKDFLDKNCSSVLSVQSSLGPARFGLSSNLQQRLQDFMHPDSASTPKVQQELLDFMGPDSANTQQVQQALQMKYQSESSTPDL